MGNSNKEANNTTILNTIENLAINNYTNGSKSLIEKTLCIDNNGKGGNKSPENLINCHIAKYIEKEDKFICYKCLDGYILDKEANLCNKEKELNRNDNCELENIGTEANPIYSCKICNREHNYRYLDYFEIYDEISVYYYNNYYVDYFNENNYYDSNYIMVKEENINICINKNEIQNYHCSNATVNKTYLTYKYNCINCTSYLYLPYNSKFYERRICQNIDEDIMQERNLSNISLNFNVTENILAVNGKCEKDNFFTPDGKHCFLCNDKKVGIPACKGTCNFALKRYDFLKCERKCDTGYIQIREGKCELCDNVNRGCYECHYDEKFPDDFVGIKTKRRFVCDFCEIGYYLQNDTCHRCPFNCDSSKINSKKIIECEKCKKNYFLKGNETCSYCGDPYQFLSNDKCVDCFDDKNGGIKECFYCEKNENKVICRMCKCVQKILFY